MGSKLPLGSSALGRLGCPVRQREVWLLVDIQDDSLGDGHERDTRRRRLALSGPY